MQFKGLFELLADVINVNILHSLTFVDINVKFFMSLTFVDIMLNMLTFARGLIPLTNLPELCSFAVRY